MPSVKTCPGAIYLFALLLQSATLVSSGASAAPSAPSNSPASGSKGRSLSPQSLTRVSKSSTISFDPKDAKKASLRTRASDVDGFRLRQKSEFTGEVDVLTSGIGSKITVRKNSLSFIVVPESDCVTVVNDAAKSFCTIPISAWKPPFAAGNLVRGDEFVDLRVTGERSETFRGLQATRKELKSIRKFDRAALRKMEKTQVASAVVTVTTKLQSDNGFNKVASGLFALPVFEGYPLAESYVNAKDKDHDDLETESLERTRIKLSEFEAPVGFKRVDTLKEIYAFTRDNARLKDILDIF